MTDNPFVLVHGAWYGGWAWKPIVPLLEAAGHRAYAPTLSGLGDRAHQIAPDIDLSTHVEDILRFLFYEDLSNVILVGHSYGGMVISGVVEQASERIAHAVWLDAFLPDDGDSITSLAADVPLAEIAASEGDGDRIPCLMPDREFGIDDPVRLAWTRARLTDQPFGAFLEAAHIDPAGWKSVQKSYILTSPERFPAYAERALTRGYTVIERSTWWHDVMSSHPTEIADILLDLAHGRSPSMRQ